MANLIDRDVIRYSINKKGEIFEPMFVPMDRIMCVPIVDASPVVHGHWVGLCGEHILPDANGKVGTEGCICSCCGEYLVGSDEYIVNGKFCPSCGAKMDEKDG